MINDIAGKMLSAYIKNFPLDKGKSRLIEISHEVFRLGRVVDFTTTFQARMQLDLNQYVDRQIYYFGAYEKEVLDLMKYFNSLNQFDFMLDVGANIGQHSLYSAVSLGIQSVYSFEPAPLTFSKLAHNISLNPFPGIIVPVNCAVSDVETWVVMEEPSSGNVGQDYIREVGEIIHENKTRSIILDEFLGSNSIVGDGIMKIDVEGAEAKVLRGCTDSLKAHKIKVAFIELVSNHLSRFGDDARSIVEKMDAYGYIPYIVTKQGLTKLDKQAIPENCQSVFVVNELAGRLKNQ